ncbi:hypothetical protein BDV95DRAFT_571803 [Massariosphaeria phaeospora]|uniref:Uncharacterized protein n=1 Tax=Massariosphaeria phaeospora TaxID=100035 RepID=A0A7C8I969_9PLEO|nr:hypothetical protein BDV95DRAFT_571803 [Massariosphaeria phaeospora]
MCAFCYVLAQGRVLIASPLVIATDIRKKAWKETQVRSSVLTPNASAHPMLPSYTYVCLDATLSCPRS